MPWLLTLPPPQQQQRLAEEDRKRAEQEHHQREQQRQMVATERLRQDARERAAYYMTPVRMTVIYSFKISEVCAGKSSSF